MQAGGGETNPYTNSLLDDCSLASKELEYMLFFPQLRAGRPCSEGGVWGVGPNQIKMWSNPRQNYPSIERNLWSMPQMFFWKETEKSQHVTGWTWKTRGSWPIMPNILPGRCPPLLFQIFFLLLKIQQNTHGAPTNNLIYIFCHVFNHTPFILVGTFTKKNACASCNCDV